MILVTGATGLVGSHLIVKLLQENKKVKAIFRTEKKKNNTIALVKKLYQNTIKDKIIWIQANITDVSSLSLAFENVTEVYHCAALVSFNLNDKEKLYTTNVEGTANIVNFCIDYRVKKMCYVSSIAALGDNEKEKAIITEQTERNLEKTHSHYSESKYKAELEVWRGSQEGLNVVIVNPGVILGYGFKKGTNAIIEKVKQKNRFYTNGTIAIIAVKDVVNCMFLLMEQNHYDQYILVAETPTIQHFLNTIANSVKVKPPTIKIGKKITALFWKIDWLLSKLYIKKHTFTKSIAQTLHTTTYYSNNKIKTTLNYTFLKTPQIIQNTITSTI